MAGLSVLAVVMLVSPHGVHFVWRKNNKGYD